MQSHISKKIINTEIRIYRRYHNELLMKYQTKGYAKWVNQNIWALNRMQKQPEEVETAPGEQCEKPYRCWYYEYCHPAEAADTDNTEKEEVSHE